MLPKTEYRSTGIENKAPENIKQNDRRKSQYIYNNNKF